jgi:hypothetical protein
LFKLSKYPIFNGEKTMLSKKELLKSLLGKKIDMDVDDDGISISERSEISENSPDKFYEITKIGEDVFEAIFHTPSTIYDTSPPPPKIKRYYSIDYVVSIEVS